MTASGYQRTLIVGTSQPSIKVINSNIYGNIERLVVQIKSYSSTGALSLCPSLFSKFSLVRLKNSISAPRRVTQGEVCRSEAPL